jgi:hypothetical protein
MCEKAIETNLPETVKVNVLHLHAGNSSARQRKGHSYRTIARLYDKRTDRLVGSGESYCSKRESPSRKTGRAVAVGRAMVEAGFK